MSDNAHTSTRDRLQSMGQGVVHGEHRTLVLSNHQDNKEITDLKPKSMC